MVRTAPTYQFRRCSLAWYIFKSLQNRDRQGDWKWKCFEFCLNFLYLSPSSQSLLMLYHPDFKEKFWVQQLAFHFKHCLLCTRAMSYFTPKYQVSNDAGSIKKRKKGTSGRIFPVTKCLCPIWQNQKLTTSIGFFVDL